MTLRRGSLILHTRSGVVIESTPLSLIIEEPGYARITTLLFYEDRKRLIFNLAAHFSLRETAQVCAALLGAAVDSLTQSLHIVPTAERPLPTGDAMQDQQIIEIHEGHRISLNAMPKKEDGSPGRVDGLIKWGSGNVSIVQLHHVGTADPTDAAQGSLATADGVECWVPRGALATAPPELVGPDGTVDVVIEAGADVDLGRGVSQLIESVTLRCIPLGAVSLNLLASAEVPLPSPTPVDATPPTNTGITGNGV